MAYSLPTFPGVPLVVDTAVVGRGDLARRARPGRDATPAGPAEPTRMPVTTAVVVGVVAATTPFSYGLVESRWVWTALVMGAIALGGLGVLLAGGAFRGFWLAMTGLAVVATATATVNVGFSRTHLTVGAVFVVLWGLLPVAARSLARTRDFGAVAGRWWVIGQSLSSLAALAQVAGLTVFGWSLTNGRAPGLSGHPNILGLLAAVAVLLCVQELLARRGPTPVVAGLLLLNLAAMLASGSLTSMFSMLLGLVVMLAIYRTDSRVVMTAVLVAVVVGTLAVAFGGALGFQAVGDRIAQTTGQDTTRISTLDDRVNRFDVAWEGVQRDPVYGAGLDDASGSTTDVDAVTHQIILRAWFQGGLALLAAVLVVYTVLLTDVVRAIRAHTAAASAGVVVLMFAFAMTSASFSQPYFWIATVAAWAVTAEGLACARGIVVPRALRRVPAPRASARSRPTG